MGTTTNECEEFGHMSANDSQQMESACCWRMTAILNEHHLTARQTLTWVTALGQGNRNQVMKTVDKESGRGREHACRRVAQQREVTLTFSRRELMRLIE